MPGRDLALAPGVESVVDEPALFQEPLVVGFHVQPADADGQQSRPGRVGAEVVGDVGGVHDLGQPRQRWVPGQVAVLDEDLEGALAVAVGVAGARRVEADGARAFGLLQDLAGGDVEDCTAPGFVETRFSLLADLVVL